MDRAASDEPGRVGVWGRQGLLEPEVSFEWAKGHSMSDVVRQPALAYWLVDPEKHFLFKAAEVADLAGWQPSEVSARVASLVTVRWKAHACDRCGNGGPPVQNRTELASLRRAHRRAGYTCQECESLEREERARQQRAQAQEATLKRERLLRDAQQQYGLWDGDPLCVQDLDFKSLVCLLALFRRPLDDDLTRTLPLEDWPNTDSYAPAALDEDEILHQLCMSGYLLVHPESSIDAFDYTATGRVGFFIQRTSFTAPGVGPTRKRNVELVKDIHAALKDPWPAIWRKEALDFTKELLLAEAIDYLVYCLKERDFTFTVGERTRQVLGRALELFCLGAVYNFIWAAATNASDFYQRKRVPKLQAANTVVGAIERRLEKAMAEHWDVKAYRRMWQLPWSVLSETLLVGTLALPDPMTATIRDIEEAIANHRLKGLAASGWVDERRPTWGQLVREEPLLGELEALALSLRDLAPTPGKSKHESAVAAWEGLDGFEGIFSRIKRLVGWDRYEEPAEDLAGGRSFLWSSQAYEVAIQHLENVTFEE